MITDPTAKSRRVWLPIAALAILAPGLGGSTTLWAEATVLIVTATLFVASPPRRSPGLVWDVLILALFLLVLAAFLPGSWFAQTLWQARLGALGTVPFAKTRTLLPWLSCEAGFLLITGAAWSYYLLAHRWEGPERHQAARFYAAGVVLLAGLALATHSFGFTVPFWPRVLNSATGFGFFPNRNQTGNVLALCAIMVLAITFGEFKKGRMIGFMWAGCLGVLGVALTINYSRAGILLFVAGSLLWIAGSLAITGLRKSGVLALAGLCILVAVFFLFGGQTLQRFQSPLNNSQDSWSDFRTSIQHDALALSLDSPWLGQGPGTFEPIFGMSREKSVMQKRALHPESDWLWVAVEMGWPAVLLLVGALLWWLRQCFPFRTGSDPIIRSAAAVCGVAFAVHSLVDVSGHRVGSAWPALVLFSLAIHPDREMRANRWVAPLFRVLGLLLAAVGFWWLASYRGWQGPSLPTSQTLAQLQSRLDSADSNGDHEGMVRAATEALRIAPLDWTLYYRRGLAEAVLYDTSNAARDFQTARILEPHWVESCFREGEIWLDLDQPERAVDAWKEALRRAKEDAPRLYRRMLAAAGPALSVRMELQRLAQTDRDYLLAFLESADRFECELEISALLAEDPTLESLTHAQRAALFESWFQRGDRPLLVSSLLTHADWLKGGWRWLARDNAEHRDFQKAYRLAVEFAPAPAIPKPEVRVPLAELEREFRYSPNDLQRGLLLALSQEQNGDTNAALETVRALLKLNAPPTYLSYWESELWAKREDWEKAWSAWQRYVQASSKP